MGNGGRGVGGPARSGSSTFWDSLQAAWGIPDLRRRIVFVFAMFGVYTVGLHVPIANINHAALDSMFNTGGKGGNNLLAMIDNFSGGALKNFTVFAMGIIPYINASIIMQLMTFAIPELQEKSREGESGRRYIAQITRFATVGLAFIQACGLCWLFHSKDVLPSPITFTNFVSVYLPTVLSLVAGTSFLMWLGEMITERGIGNGVSLIIFASIMVRLPYQIGLVIGQVEGGSVNPLQALILVLAFFSTVVGIIYMTLGQRRVPIQHVRRIVGNKMSQGGQSYLPFRVNAAGVIPIIFAVSIQLLPATLANYVPAGTQFMHLPVGTWVHAAADWFSPGKNILVAIIYAAIIMFFTYFWTAVMMDIPHMAQELKKYGSFIPGIRPGKATEEYLDKVMTRITFGGAVFLALVALLNYWVPAITNTGSSFTLVGGTSLLIVVGVALDTMQAIEAQLLMRHYEGFIR
jgi:preprotein translocase subunit SecY